MSPTYLDYNATTPLDPRVLEAMSPWLTGRAGNASSRHDYGRRARGAVDVARQQVAAAVGAHPTEILFTSGGSEANNLFIKGAAASCKSGLLAISAVEHPCVREPARALRAQGFRLEQIAVDGQGRIANDSYRTLIDQRPALVSVMLANNETGVVQDIAALATAARDAGAWFHADTVQAFGKLPIDFRSLNASGVNALTLSSHKIYGPLGAGALVLDKRVELQPLIHGGGQERGLRSGTENVAAIVGFGRAAELAMADLECFRAQQTALRQQLETALDLSGFRIHGAGAQRLPNTSFFSVPGIEGETLVGKLDRAGFAVASGSACSSAQPEPSATLIAMGVDVVTARGAVRVSLGRDTRASDIERFIDTLDRVVQDLRQLTAVAV